MRLTIALLTLALCVAVPVLAQEDDFPAYPGPAGWSVKIDRLREVLDPLNKLARERRAPFHVNGIAFELTRENGPDRSYEDRKLLIDYWQLQIGNLLEEQDFYLADESDLERMGMSKEQFRQMMLKRVPYGMRDLTEQKLAQEIYVLIDESPDGCPGDNGYGAVVVGTYPTEDVADEYGELAMFIFGAGECASRGASRQTLDGIVDTVRDSVVGY